MADAAPAARPLGAWPILWLAHGAAALLAVGGVLAEVLRPLAPAVAPLPARAWFSAEYLVRARAYRDPLYVVLVAALVIRLLVVVLPVVTPLGRRLVARAVALAGPGRPWLAAALVAVVLVAAADVALLPLSWWAGYVHEGRFGFRTQGAAGWWRDWLLAVAPAWAAVAVLAAGGVALASRLPRSWPAVAALGASALGGLVVLLAPLVLEPLQFRTAPLPPSPVRDEVLRVLAAADVDVDAIVVADASRRTTKLNAYISGLGPTRRVVLYDTLVADRPPAQVGLVLAHELGHHLHDDLPRGVLFGAAGTVATVYLLAFLLRRRAVREQVEVGDPALVPFAVAVVSVLLVLSLPIQSAVSRRAEAAADAASLALTEQPRVFLEMESALARANLADPTPPRWAYVLWFSHPTVTQRLALGQRAVEQQR